MNLIPVTPGLLWLLDSAPNPRNYIAGVPDDYEALGTPEADLDLLGFAQDTSLRPPVWTLELGPLKFQAYKVPAYQSHIWRLEVSANGRQVSTEDYDEEYEAQQIPSDVRRAIQDFKREGLRESVDPKKFMDQAPDLREFLVQRYQKYADLIPSGFQTEYGFAVDFFITASVPTVRSLIEQITTEAGISLQEIWWTCKTSTRDENKPERRHFRVVYRELHYS